MDVPVRKTWNDAAFGGTRSPITLELLANGTATGKTVVLDGTVDDVETTACQAAFKGLPKYDGDWNEIAYTVRETTQLGAGWTSEVNQPTEDTPYWEFVNAYEPAPVRVSIPVTKRLAFADGATPPDVTGRFTFTLADDPTDDVDSPLPGETSVVCGGDGQTVSFGEVEYTTPGTYRYLVTETGEVPGVSNDPDAQVGKAVTVTVTDDGSGALKAAVTGADSADGQPSASTTFTNTYAPTPVRVSIPVTKRLAFADGLTPPDVAGRFTFTLVAKDGAPLPEKDVTVTNPGSGADHDGGTAWFGEIAFDRPGTYTYLITESGQVENVTNDAMASSGKTVTVTVTDDGSGALKAAMTGADATDATTFENSYVEPPVPSEEPPTSEPPTSEPSTGTPSTGDDSSGILTLSIAMLTAGLCLVALTLAKRRRG